MLEESLFVAMTAAPTCPVLDGGKGCTVNGEASEEAHAHPGARARGDARDPAHPGHGSQRAAHAVGAQVLELVMLPASSRKSILSHHATPRKRSRPGSSSRNFSYF